MDDFTLSESNWHAACGGQRRAAGIGVTADFGWVPSDPDLKLVQVTGPDGNMRPLFEAVDPYEDTPSITGDRVMLWEWVRAACLRMPSQALPYFALYNGLPPYSWQFTGSCVHSGGFNASMTRELIEVACLGMAESPKIPYCLLAYGQSRYLAFRDSSQGEGSSGDAMAQALAKFGAPPIDTPGLPTPHLCGPAIAYSRADELTWSSVNNQPAAILAVAKPHTATYGLVNSADEAEAELRRLRPLTWAGDWGGQMSGVVKGSPPVLMMPRRETWNHQQSVLGFWRHPELGRIWRIQNNWFNPGPDMKVTYTRTRDGQMLSTIVKDGVALPMHGENPDGGFAGPPGGYYVTDADMDYQCRNGEVRSIKSIRGYVGAVDLGKAA